MIWNIPKSVQEMDWRRMQWLSYSVTIPANTNSQLPLNISNDGDFRSYFLGGQYTSLIAGPTDGGACDVSIKMTDNGRRWEIFDNLIPMSMFCSPGRQRSSGVAGDPSNPLFQPIYFPYIFLKQSSIKIEYANAANYANTIWLVFYGEREFAGSNYVAQEPQPIA